MSVVRGVRLNTNDAVPQIPVQSHDAICASPLPVVRDRYSFTTAAATTVVFGGWLRFAAASRALSPALGMA